MDGRNQAIVGKVRRALTMEPRVDATQIRISLIGGDLLLSGIVDDAAQAATAERLARQAAPEVAIDNSLTVGGLKRSDGGLKRQVDAAFQAMPERLAAEAANVGAEVRRGTAYLQGTCASLAQRTAYIVAASGVNGVGAVDADRLTIAPSDDDPARLGARAWQALQREAPQLAIHVAIMMHGRSARLEGRLRTHAERERAVAIVSAVPGIQSLRDQLVVYQAGERSDGDARIEQAVVHAIGSEPQLPAANIAVFFAGGVLTLLGAVESIEQKRRAAAIARAMVEGGQVDDQLEVNYSRGEPPLPESKLRQGDH